VKVRRVAGRDVDVQQRSPEGFTPGRDPIPLLENRRGKVQRLGRTRPVRWRGRIEKLN
jgi:hypothetical protein